jgi:hypothetical protein
MADMEITGGKLFIPSHFTSFDGFATAMQPAMWQIGYLIQADMAHYPPPKPTSHRDGTLGKAWTVTVVQKPGSIESQVSNRVSYAPWVQNYQFQARMHRNYWQTDREVIEKRAPDIIALLNNRIILLSVAT